MHIEIPPLAHWNFHSVKEAGALEVSHHFHSFALGRNVAGNLEILRIAGTAVAHGKVRSERGCGDAGRVAQFIEERGLKS